MFVGGVYLIDFNRDVIKFLYGSLFISTHLLLLKKSYDKKTHFNLVINLSLTVFKKITTLTILVYFILLIGQIFTFKYLENTDSMKINSVSTLFI